MTSSEGEEYHLDSADVNEEFDFEDGDNETGYYTESNDESDNEYSDTDTEPMQKYSEELEYEDSGEPATFNFNIHSGEPVYSLDFLQGTEFLATGSGDDRALLVDARELQVLADLGAAGDSIISVKFYQGKDAKSEDAPVYLATASMDGSVRIYCSDPESGIELKGTLEGPGEGVECNWIDWHSRGPILIAGYADGSVWMWNAALIATGSDPVMAIFAGHVTTPATSGAFSPDGKMIISGSEEGVLLVHNPKDPGSPLAKIVPQSHQETALNEVTHVAVHPGNQIFLAGDSDGHLRVYKTAGMNQSMPLSDLSSLHSASIEAIGFHPLGSLAVSASMDGHAVIWDCHATFGPRHNIQSSILFDDSSDIDAPDTNNDSSIDGFTLAKWLSAMPNGPALPPALSFGLLLGTAQGRLAIVEGRSGLRLRRLRGRPGRPVLDAAVSVNGILAVAFDDGIISLYQL